MKVLRLITVALASFILASCYDFSMYEEIKVEPVTQTWVFPVLKSTITFKELVERSEANTLVDVIPGTTLFYLSFRDTIDFVQASSMYSMSPATFSQTVSVPGGLPPVFPAGTQVAHSQTFEESFEAIPGVELKRIDFSSGMVRIRLQNSFQHPVSGHLTLTSLVNSSESPIVYPFNLAAGSPDTDFYLLNNLFLNLHVPPSTYNTFRFSVNFTITSSGNANTSGGLGVQVEFSGINPDPSPDFEMFSGKLNATVNTGLQNSIIAVFNSTLLATQHFAEPSITYSIRNSFGVPVSFAFSQFEVKNNAGSTIPLVNEGTLSSSDLNLSGPNVLNYVEQITQPYATTSFLLNRENSNVEDVFEIAPNRLAYQAAIVLGDNSDNHDYFVRKNSNITFFSDITLPLNGWATTHLLSDTVDNIDLPSIDSLGYIDSIEYKVTLKFKFQNELPMNMEFQVDFLDETNQLVEALFPEGEQQMVQAAPVGTNGESNGSNSKYTLVELDRERYNRIRQSKRMILFYRMSTGGTSGQPVRVLSTNKVTVQVSAIVKATINPQNL